MTPREAGRQAYAEALERFSESGASPRTVFPAALDAALDAAIAAEREACALALLEVLPYAAGIAKKIRERK